MSKEREFNKLLHQIAILAGLHHVIEEPPPPEQGDGQPDPKSPEELETGIAQDLAALKLEAPKDLLFLIKQFLFPDKFLNDSKLPMEKIIQILSKLPMTSKFSKTLGRILITDLWDNIVKPPTMLAGDAYRSADGSNYSRLYPWIGKAGSRYARSVPIKKSLPYILPDSGTIFDTLMVRKDFTPHPSGISSTLFYLAIIITHDLFNTGTDPSINLNSSYLDLAPLYGSSEDQQATIRTFQHGLLKPDTFADSRILLQPPGVRAMLLLFSRNHNYVAKRLLQINERGRFSVKDPNNKDQLRKQDEDLFQTARLINCGFYLEAVLHDYLHSILGLNNTNSSWFLDPTMEYSKVGVFDALPTGMGNQVSLEFNYIYRWHPAVSQQDEEWIEGEFKRILGSDYPQPGKDISISTFMKKSAAWQMGIPKDPSEWSFPDMERINKGDKKGYFRDVDIAKALVNGTKWVAGAFGANGIPKIFRVVEMLGIESTRTMGVSSLNEFRRFLKLVPYKSFEDMNPDKEVAEKLRVLYGHIDNVELYPGLMTEKTKPPSVGSGIALPFTISRGILSDAVNLVRNDRFYTDDFNPVNLTSWGWNEIQSDPNVASGSIMYKIILRNIPGFYKSNSTWALYPFTIPSKTMENLKNRGGDYWKSFDYDTPITNEQGLTKTVPVSSYKGVTEVLSNKNLFHVTYTDNIKWITAGYGYILGWDEEPKHDQERAILRTAVYTDNSSKFLQGVKRFFAKTTKHLVDVKKTTLGGGTYLLDVVRDVCNLAPVYFVSNYFGIPLKTEENPRGIFTEQELYLQFTTLFIFLFMNLDPTQNFSLKQSSQKISYTLRDILAVIVKEYKGNQPGLFTTLTQSLFDMPPKISDDAKSMIRYLESKLKNKENGSDAIIWNIIITATGAIATIGQATSTILDFYLRPENANHLATMQKLAHETDTESEDLFLGYVLEALRLAPVVPGLFRIATDDANIDGTLINKGNLVFAALKDAHMDPTAFPKPNEIDPKRPRDTYKLFGNGIHECFGKQINHIALPEILKVIITLPNIKRAAGAAGQLNHITDQGNNIYISSGGTLWPLPTNMVVTFE